MQRYCSVLVYLEIAIGDVECTIAFTTHAIVYGTSKYIVKKSI